MSDRPDRYQPDGALHSWIDRVARLEYVSQRHLGHSVRRGVLEIQFKLPVAIGCDRISATSIPRCLHTTPVGVAGRR